MPPLRKSWSPAGRWEIRDGACNAGMERSAGQRDHSAHLKGLEGALLPILHDVQAAFGYVPARRVPLIAEALNLSRAEVHGVVTFYHDFRNQPAGRHVLKLCRAEACQSMGGEALARQVLERCSASTSARPRATAG